MRRILIAALIAATAIGLAALSAGSAAASAAVPLLHYWG